MVQNLQYFSFMRDEDQRTRKLLALDQLHAMKGLNHATQSDAATIAAEPYELLAYNQHNIQCDAIATESLTNFQELSILTNIRALLFRGKIAEAEILLEQNKNQLKDQPLTFIELIQEEARLAFFNGDYHLGLELTEHALFLKPNHISRLALTQMKVLGHFELGDFNMAIRTIEESLVLTRLFIYSSSTHYLKSLETKIIARNQSPQIARDFLLRYFEELIRSKCLTLEIVSVIVRTQIDIFMLEGKEYLSWAKANYWIAKTMGEELYVGHAVLDLYCNDQNNALWIYSKVLPYFLQRFSRLKQLLFNIENDSNEFVSTTAQTLRDFFLKHQNKMLQDQHKFRSEFDLNNQISNDYFSLRPQALFFKAFNLFVTLTTENTLFKVFDTQDRVPTALMSLASTSLTKEEFFQANWGTQKYVPHLHDGLIRNLIFRIRKRTGLNIQINNGTITLVGLLVI